MTANRWPLVGLLLVQIVLGYEWLMSGLTKIVRGGFPSGLADELTEKSEGVGGWYKSFLDDIVIPNGEVFGYLVLVGEVLVGLGLVGAALVWMLGWERLPLGGRRTLLAVTVLASLGGILLNVSFHLANASAHPWLIPGDGFDEGVDLDSVMPALQAVLIVVSVAGLRSLRSEARTAPVLGRPKPHGA